MQTQTQSRRHDLYMGIHKLVRSRLFETSVRLGRTEFAADREAEETLTFIRETLEFLADHARHEETHVHKLLRAFDGKLSDELEGAHAALDDAALAIDRLAIEIARTPVSERAPLASELYARFNLFVGEQLRHLAQEERDGNAVLWAHLTDLELRQVNDAIVRSQAPERTAWVLERMLPVWTLEERAQMWRHTSANAPPPVAALVRGIGQRALGAEAWALVERAAQA